MGENRFRALFALCSLAVCLVAVPARADVFDFHVLAGAVHPTNPEAPYEYTRYYPEQLQVHRSQTVRWTLAGNPNVGGPFHTITFSDAGRPAAFRADEVPGTWGTSDAWTFGSACGRNGLAACVLDESTTFLSNGIPPFGNSPFDVVIDLPAGSYGYFCTIHPSMAGQIDVVDDTQPLPTQAQIDAEVADQIQADSAAADALAAAGQVPVSTVEDGQTVWRVLLGDSTEDNHVSIIAFLPSSLDVGAGDKLRYVYRERIVNEIHTATFPSDAVSQLFMVGFHPSCDPDDPEGGAPGVPGLWGVVGPDCPANLELVLSPWMTGSTTVPGSQVLAPGQYHDSGMLIPPGGAEIYGTLPPDRALPATFEAEFPAAGQFSYACMVHGPGMSGGVSVT